ncbi:MAG: Gldg family protein [Porcipelethomonas sp.]
MSKEKPNAESAQVREKKPFLNKKKLKYGAVATVITIIFIVVVIILNLIAGILTDKKNLKLDLTKEKYYEISDETIDYLKSIDKDIEIAVMGDKSAYETGTTYTKMILETLDKYRQNSDHITVEFYDIASNPDVVSKFSQNYNGEITEGNIIISSGDRVKVTSINNLFTTESDYYGNSSITGFNGEQELTSAIMSVTDANPQRVAFIAAYNGSNIYSAYITYAVSAFSSMLDKNGYEVTTVDIFSEELSPEDYDMVVLPAPMTDISEDCITKLEDFLYNGGQLNKNMIYISDVYQYRTPNIDEFLEIWGIEIGDSWVYETDDTLTQNAQIVLGQSKVTIPSPIVTVSDENYGDLSNTKLPIVAPYSRPINLLFDANVDRTTSALLVSSDSTCLYPIQMQDAPEDDASFLDENAGDAEEEEAAEDETEETTEFDPDSADKSSQVVMALATKTNVDDNNEQHVNNLLVMGGSGITDRLITSSDLYNNAEFVINAVNKMCGKENGIIIAEKDITVDYIDVTAAQSRTINRIVIFVIPITVAVIGVVVFLRRRNR